MRNMSFAMTTEAMENRQKTVTRRNGWKFLCPGDVIRPVKKTMGLKKGEKVEPLECGPIRITHFWREPLHAILNEPDGCAKEGFPHLSPLEFVIMYTHANKRCPDGQVSRIEFEFIETPPSGSRGDE